jgi:hypothetical protein
MSTEHPDVNDLLLALALPATALVQQQVTRKMLSENAAATPTDRKTVQECLEALTWHAALKPTNVGVAAYQDELRNYLEVAVLVAKLRTSGGYTRQPNPQAAKLIPTVKQLATLVHRAVPYPTVLLLDDGEQLYVSMAHIRRAQREAERTVVDEDAVIVSISCSIAGDTGAARSAFFEAMALSRQPRLHLHALYQGWIDVLSAWQAVELTGHFKLSDSAAQAVERRAAWLSCKHLDAQIDAARRAALKEKQVARQVAANLHIKTLLTARQQAAQNL